MITKLEKALARLRRILPLKQRQAECGEEVRALHQEILRSFVTRGRILTREEMALRVSNPGVAVNVLSTTGMVLFSGTGDPVGAYPFTTEAREHKVLVNGYQVHAMCSLDALAVSPMFGMKTKIDSRCRVTGEPVHILQSGMTIENPDEVGDLHVGIGWGAADADTSCADSLCMEMIFLKDGKIARQWLADDAENREIFALPMAVEFAGRFFVPLMS
jgi:mercuric reductase